MRVIFWKPDTECRVPNAEQARALYVHVPFCGSKCAYCAFASFVPAPGYRERDVQGWLAALNMEADLRLGGEGRERGRGFSSVFVGGGTPTFLTEAELEGLMVSVVAFAGAFGEGEMTVEANPDSLTPGKADVMRRFGVNRVSLGVQSLDEILLGTLGRRHSPGDVRRAVRLLRARGFANINFDLMFGLPGQGLDVWKRTVSEAVDMEPEHLSLYGLTVEPGTPLARRLDGVSGGSNTCQLPSDDDQADMYEWVVDFLAAQGYLRYEISNFAREGFACRHNEAVWRGEDYIGLGPGAVSTEHGVRTTNASSLGAYIEAVQKIAAVPHNTNPALRILSAAANVERLSRDQRMSEYMFLGLRTAQGVSREGFSRRFGVDMMDIFGHILVKYSHDGVLAFEDDRIFLRPQYFFVANAVLKFLILDG